MSEIRGIRGCFVFPVNSTNGTNHSYKYVELFSHHTFLLTIVYFHSRFTTPKDNLVPTGSDIFVWYCM